MSTTPSLTQVSVSANVSRRTARALPPMAAPRNINRLRRLTEVGYVYDADEEEGEEGEEGEETSTTVVFAVGDNVAIYPSGDVYLDAEGDIPLMSFWFGTISGLFLQPRRKAEGHIVWVEVRWFYRVKDLPTSEPSFADHMGEYELVDSDHTSVIDITCIESELYTCWRVATKLKEKPGRDAVLLSATLKDPTKFCVEDCAMRLYDTRRSQRFCRHCRRWFHRRCIRHLVMGRNDADLPIIVQKNTTYLVTLDPDFLRLVRTPIARGGVHGISGNAKVMCSVEEALTYACQNDHLASDWKQWKERVQQGEARAACLYLRKALVIVHKNQKQCT
ncbi:hypothetical protein HYDPIDRAFT_171141 [Hydnomerulius pinastri MD-312]|uniref:BAH domain-containing protein n=1 Tax=Hydnomerulius pinastri MD-312 TaxID=994086 RepID=A0A0C9V0J2_9AGAM|nr:hypothetical protein HYDPIDRAFT_171141 [Hydnomerulius pinastri MD-312]